MQRLQNLALRYKTRFEIVENEKGELIEKNYSLIMRNEELQTKMDTEKRRLQQKANDSDLETQSLKKHLMDHHRILKVPTITKNNF